MINTLVVEEIRDPVTGTEEIGGRESRFWTLYFVVIVMYGYVGNSYRHLGPLTTDGKPEDHGDQTGMNSYM